MYGSCTFSRQRFIRLLPFPFHKERFGGESTPNYKLQTTNSKLQTSHFKLFPISRWDIDYYFDYWDSDSWDTEYFDTDSDIGCCNNSDCTDSDYTAADWDG